MGKVDDIARRFSLAGVLDEDAQAQRKYPIAEIEVADIADNPGNEAYSMDPSGIARLAESIRKDGLTDIPLVRRLDDGGFQMVSGHRRKAAYSLLAQTDPAFAKMPCRVVDGIDDAQALALLHTANYFTRELNVVERAKATRALGIQVERIREEDPNARGVPSAELKAAIIRSQTGRNVSAATIKRQEQTARRVERDLVDEWRDEALAGNLSDTDIAALASMDEGSQREAYREKADSALDRKGTSAAIKRAAGKRRQPDAVKLARSALKSLRAARDAAIDGERIDGQLADELRRALEELLDAAGSN